MRLHLFEDEAVARLDWKPFSVDVLPATMTVAGAGMDMVFTVLTAVRQQPGHVLPIILNNQTLIALKSDSAGRVFYATPSPDPDDFAAADEDNIEAVPGVEAGLFGDTRLGAHPTGYREATAQGTDYTSKGDDMKGNMDAQRTEDDDSYSGQVGATDRGEAFELTPVDQDPRMAGEDADGSDDARDYVQGFGNAESVTEDTDYWDRPMTDDDKNTDRDSPMPPEGKQLLTEPSEESAYDLPWGEPSEGYRKVGVGEAKNPLQTRHTTHFAVSLKPSLGVELAMKITEVQFHKLAHAALSVMEKVSAHPKVRNLVTPLDRIVNEAADAIAESVLDGRIQNAGERYTKLHGQYREVIGAIEEGWIMFPALGLSNNFAGDGAMADTGVESWGTDLINANDSGKANTVGARDAQGGVNAEIERAAKQGESADKIAKKILEGR